MLCGETRTAPQVVLGNCEDRDCVDGFGVVYEGTMERHVLNYLRERRCLTERRARIDDDGRHLSAVVWGAIVDKWRVDNVTIGMAYMS